MSYRVYIQPKDLWTAAFAFFADANRWAMGYARGLPRPCKVKVIAVKGAFDRHGKVSACYLGDGEGRARNASDEVGESLAA